MLALRNNQIAPSAVPVVPAAPVRWALTAGCVSVALLLAACGKGDGGAGASGPGGARPAPEVGVVTVQLGDVGLLTELPGRLEASRVAQVRARAAGIVQKRVFREGSDVKAGQSLFVIDAAPYAAALQSAEAAVARSEANLTQVRRWPHATRHSLPRMRSASKNMPALLLRTNRRRPMWPLARRRCKRRALT